MFNQTDLSNCDLEPIHIPGKIQSHGFLVVIDNQSIVQFISINCQSVTGQSPSSYLGKPLSIFEEWLITDTPGFTKELLRENSRLTSVSINDQPFNLIITPASEYTLLEFEPASSDDMVSIQRLINQSIPVILGGNKLQEVLDYAAEQVKAIIGYDRVMIYRFAPDGHGEVVAEAKNENLEPWLGLHYPASDIPRQARELYKLNPVRLIASVHATDIPVATYTPDAVLEMTYSQLRAVSPIHIQYLKNMGVASSYSISLLYQGELWGLIACHNYSPKFIAYQVREASKLVGQILSAALEFRQHNENLQIKALYLNAVESLTKFMAGKSSLEEALTEQDVTLVNVVQCTGAILAYEGKVICIGQTPDRIQVSELLRWITAHHPGEIFHTSSLHKLNPAATAYQEIAAGLLVLPLSSESNECIIWFKEEQRKEVKWAGNPDKPVDTNGGLQQISPRHSFSTWVKEVRGVSSEWTIEEIHAVEILKDEILTSISTKASAARVMNERLRIAYEELDTFSYTISHDLKTPLTAIKGYAQLLSADKTLSDQGIQILNRIADRAEKMNFMIKAVLEYSRVGRLEGELAYIDTNTIVKEILQDFEQSREINGLNITVGNMPPLRGDPVMMWQVFNNLISNAVKYSQRKESPKVQIEGWTADNKTFFSIKDNGIGIPRTDLDKIFLLFSRMSNVSDIEGSGVGLAIVKKIVEKHGGIIWAESELGEGTTMFLSFTTS